MRFCSEILSFSPHRATRWKVFYREYRRRSSIPRGHFSRKTEKRSRSGQKHFKIYYRVRNRLNLPRIFIGMESYTKKRKWGHSSAESHLIRIEILPKDVVLKLLASARRMKELCNSSGGDDRLKRKILCCLCNALCSWPNRVTVQGSC